MRTIRQGDLLSRIRALGYTNPVYANRFDRVVDGLELSIDLLTASGTTKHHPRMDGYGIDIDGMPAVDEALDRDPVILDLRYPAVGRHQGPDDGPGYRISPARSR
jgi:hypothetical protein